MKSRLLALIARIDTLPQRERLALAGGLVALAIGVQALSVVPTRAKRIAIAESSAESDRSRADAEQAAIAEEAAAFERLRTRNHEVEGKLALLGLKASQREAVGTFVTRTLRGEGVRLAALTALPVEELVTVDAAITPEADATPTAADAGTAAAAPAPARPALFRHRAELRLEGPVKGVVLAIEQLERELTPLRVERIRLVPSGNAGAVQASLVLTTISEERTWLAL